MSGTLYAIYGVSGYGREVMPIARKQLAQTGRADDRLVFVDDFPRERVVNGQSVVTYSEFLSLPAEKRFVAIAIADSAIRQRLAERCVADGIAPWQIRDESVVVMDEVEIAPGAILSPFVTLTSNVRIGRYFHANIYSYVAHDCLVGDYVTLAPSVQCNGNIVIEDHAYIGTAAILKQGEMGKPLVIGRGAVVGMGAVVTKSVPAGVTVVGNPARALDKTSTR
jgi:sugar O-acyltransferase (sialic acid O-acetyltransferase NeuD family)